MFMFLFVSKYFYLNIYVSSGGRRVQLPVHGVEPGHGAETAPGHRHQDTRQVWVSAPVFSTVTVWNREIFSQPQL